MIERDRTDLPDPDSPTIPSVLPRSSTIDTLFTATASPRGVLNDVLRSVTSSRRPASRFAEIVRFTSLRLRRGLI